MKISRTLITASGIADFDVAAAAHAHAMRAWRSHMERVVADEAAGVPAAERHVAYPAPRAHALVETAVDEHDKVNYEVEEDGPSPEQVFAEKKAQLLIQVMQAEQTALARVVPPGKRRMFGIREADIRRADAELAARLSAEHAAKVAAAAEEAARLRNEHAETVETVLRQASKLRAAHSEIVERAAAALANHVEEINRISALAAEEAKAARPGLLATAAIAVGVMSAPARPEPVYPEAPPPPPEPPTLPELPEPPELPIALAPPDLAAEIAAARTADDARFLEEMKTRREAIAKIERAAAQAHHDIEDLTAETVGGWAVPDFN